MLGHARRRLGDLDSARTQYQRAQSLNAESAEPAFYLGVIEREAGSHWAAAEAYLRAALLEPSNGEAHQRMLDALKDALRAGDAPMLPQDEVFDQADDRSLISFVICSIDDDKFNRVGRQIEQAMAGTPYEIVGIHDAKSLCEGYNRGAARARGELLVFCHDDIEILDTHFRARLTHALAQFDVVGVAGTVQLGCRAWSWAGHPHLHGWVGQPVEDSDPFALCVFGLGPALAGGMQAIDGVLIAMRRNIYNQIGFDDQRFDGFHFYDLDFSYRAYRAGLRVGVARDLLLFHLSYGSPDAAWHRYAEVFREKHPELAGREPEVIGNYFAIKLATREEMLRYCRALRALLARSQALLAPARLPADDLRSVRARALATA
jgi:GT2 family glycosyltransferase